MSCSSASIILISWLIPWREDGMLARVGKISYVSFFDGDMMDWKKFFSIWFEVSQRFPIMYVGDVISIKTIKI